MKKKAQQLLLRAYVGEIIDNISNEEKRNKLMEIVIDRLPKED